MESFLKKIIEHLSALVTILKDQFGKEVRYKTKYQTITVTKANLTVAGRYTDSQELDTNFEFADGVQVIELGTGGIAFYSIGIEDKNNTYHTITHKKDWQAGSDTPINDRYKDIFIQVVRGEKLDIKTEFANNLAAELSYQIIFRLRKKI
ncbi:MAG: hypothetical protein AAB638_00745 [Patescibacteria group bacterium]